MGLHRRWLLPLGSAVAFPGTPWSPRPSEPPRREQSPVGPLCDPDMEVKDKRFTKREEVLSETPTSSLQRYDSFEVPVTHCHISRPENYPQYLFSKSMQRSWGSEGAEEETCSYKRHEEGPTSCSDCLHPAASTVVTPLIHHIHPIKPRWGCRD